jgi:hypothetical protein
VGGGGEFNFPHLLAQEALREARQPTTSSNAPRKKDYDLGIHYTSAVDDAGAGGRPERRPPVRVRLSPPG